MMKISKTLPQGCSKTTYYDFLASYMCDIAQTESVNDVYIPMSFTPVLLFSNAKREKDIPLEGNYLWGYYKNINFYVDLALKDQLKIGKMTIDLD